jgi:hypothetical protein
MIKIQNISIIAKIAIPASFLAMVAMLIVLAASWSMTQ